ncbi:MAG: prepilin-type N-terminal cleavage/methylation domain-containing protein [Mariprofundus sp.]|nr:prepilin-type N-terminal cleavage/methylation domain-containing protein [Mariprofundus sp.]
MFNRLTSNTGSYKPESGFTLLEILMVIVILSVSTMMVAPSFFSALSASLDDEADRLVQTLRLAQDEAALSSQSLRISFRAHSYAFQSSNAEGEWTAFNQPPYQHYKLAEGIRFDRIKPQLPLSEKIDLDQSEAVLAYLLIPAQGIHQIADISLHQDSDNRQIHIQFGPGPGGIKALQDTP